MPATDHAALRKLIEYAAKEADAAALDFTAQLLRLAAASLGTESVPVTRPGAAPRKEKLQ